MPLKHCLYYKNMNGSRTKATRKFNWNIIKIIDEGSSKTERFLLKSRWKMKTS